MKNAYSYFFLIGALIIDSIFGFSTIQFPDSFAKRGALPRIDEWRVNRVRAASNRFENLYSITKGD